MTTFNDRARDLLLELYLGKLSPEIKTDAFVDKQFEKGGKLDQALAALNKAYTKELERERLLYTEDLMMSGYITPEQKDELLGRNRLKPTKEDSHD